MLAILKVIAPIATPILSKIFRGENAKGNAAGATGVISATILYPLMQAFADGFLEGSADPVHQLGVVMGAAVFGWIINKAVVWLTANQKEL